MIFGLTTFEELPEGWTPLEAVVAVKCLDETGDIQVFKTATSALNSWEALGMLRDVQLQLEAALKDDPDGE